MKRITPEEVVEAFKNPAIKPTQKTYMNSDYRCCGLTSILVESRGGDPKPINALLNNRYNDITTPPYLMGYELIAQQLDLDPVYASGFASGWDQDLLKKAKPIDSHTDPRIALGLSDGRAAWRAVQDSLEVGAGRAACTT